MLAQGHWLTEFVSISRILGNAPMQSSLRGAIRLYSLQPVATRGDREMPDKGPGSQSGGKKPKGGTKAGGGKKKK